MSYLTNGNLVECNALQRSLNEFSACNPSQIMESMALLQFLMSEQNRGRVKLQPLVAPGGGKLRQVQAVYEPRLSTSLVTDSCDAVCESTNTRGQSYQLYDMDDAECTSTDWKVDLVEMRKICETDESYFNRQILDRIALLDRVLAQKTAAQLGEFVGSFGPDETDVTNNIKTISTLYADGRIDENGLQDIDYAIANAEYCSAPALFGWSPASVKYFQKLAAGCCSDWGFDVGTLFAQNGKAFFKDKYVGAAFDGDIVAVALGAVQLLTYNQYEGGLRSFDSELVKQTTVTSPNTGITYDFLYNRGCSTDINLQLKVMHKLVGMPNDMFDATDDLSGVTWVNRFKIVNP